MELSNYVDKSRISALNQDNSHPVANLYIYGNQYHLKSDADDQLIINLPFNTKLKLVGFRLVAMIPEEQPKVVKFYKDLPSLDFDDCEEVEADFEATLTAHSVTETSEIVAFPAGGKQFGAGVDVLTIFVESSTGGDLSSIERIELYGEAINVTNMSDLKKVG